MSTRRSICYSEPNLVMAGEIGTWRFIYTPAVNLPKGTKIKFDLQTKGRMIDWELPTTNLKKGKNVIFATIGSGNPIEAKEVLGPNSIVPQYEFTLPAPVAAGKTFTIVIGALKGGKNTNKSDGNTVQTNVQRRRMFLLYIDTTGKGRYDEPESFSIDIRGNVLQTIKVVAPSFVMRNRRFDVVVRFEDQFGNLTSNAVEDTLIELSHEHLRENLNWKIFIPETGFLALPNLYFNEPGTYKIQLKNTKTKELFFSAPIRCFGDTHPQLFWGLIHGESERYDSTENIESCLRHFRDEKGYNFYATSPFENVEETSNEIWKQISQSSTELNEEGRFATILGFQFAGTAGSEGVRTILFNKDNKTLPRKKDAKYNTLKKLYKCYSPKEIISIPSFTMGKKTLYDFKNFDHEYERVVEIYNAWGSSERTKKEGNPAPIEANGKSGVQESPEGSIQKALLQNHRFGFVGGGLDDRGIYADLYEDGQEQYPPGLTAIIAPEYTKESMWDAIFKRHCYATTGERMIVGIYIAGAQMGSELSTAEKRGLLVNRHISGFVAGTKKLKTVEIIRNGKVIHTYKPTDYTFDFAYDDLEALEKIVVKSPDKRPSFAYYYLRVTQEDGHTAWSSPIWVDYIPLSALPKPKIVVKPVKKPVVIIEEEEDEDDYDYDDVDDEDEE